MPVVGAVVGLGGFFLSAWQARLAGQESAKAQQALERAREASANAERAESQSRKALAAAIDIEGSVTEAARQAEDASRRAEGALIQVEALSNQFRWTARALVYVQIWSFDEVPAYFNLLVITRALMEKSLFPDNMALTEKHQESAAEVLDVTRRLAAGEKLSENTDPLEPWEQQSVSRNLEILDEIARGLFPGLSLDGIVGSR